MKRRQTNEANGGPLGSAAAAPADGGDAERGERVGPLAHDVIARRAHELYLERGAEPGRDIEDWLRAEAELGEGRQ